jgi:DNA polymerase-1
LIDGYSLIYRSFYGFIKNPLINSKGEPTSAVFGFLVSLNKLIREKRVENIVVVFDTAKPTFRHILYKEYKANRPPMPEDLRPQIPRIFELLDCMNISVYEHEGMEADDAIATLSTLGAGQGYQNYIISKDKRTRLSIIWP